MDNLFLASENIPFAKTILQRSFYFLKICANDKKLIKSTQVTKWTLLISECSAIFSVLSLYLLRKNKTDLECDFFQFAVVAAFADDASDASDAAVAAVAAGAAVAAVAEAPSLLKFNQIARFLEIY